MQAPVIGPRLLASAGYVEDVLEQFLSYLRDGGVAGGDAAGVDVDQIVPFFGEGGAG